MKKIMIIILIAISAILTTCILINVLGKNKTDYCISNRMINNYTVGDNERRISQVLYFNRDKVNLHTNQKPLALFEYLIKTYTQENEIVLDNCMGSGSTCVAAINTNRHYIGFELEPKYFDIACKRLDEAESVII